MDFVVADKRAMHPNRETTTAGHVQHVAHAQQRLSAHLVQNRAAVDFAAHLKRQPGRDVGFDEAGDHVDAGALRCQDQMDASRACFLRQPGNQLFNLFTHHHHQIGQFVDHHHDIGQALQRLWLVRRQAEWVADQLAFGFGVVDFDVVAGQITHTHFAH